SNGAARKIGSAESELEFSIACVTGKLVKFCRRLGESSRLSQENRQRPGDVAGIWEGASLLKFLVGIDSILDRRGRIRGLPGVQEFLPTRHKVGEFGSIQVSAKDPIQVSFRPLDQLVAIALNGKKHPARAGH